MPIGYKAGVAALALGLAVWPLTAEELVYTKKVGTHITTVTVRIEPSASGYSFAIRSVRDGREITRVDLETDSSRATLAWEYRDALENIALKGERKNDRIEISGLNKGQPVKVTHAIDQRPWLQWFPFGMEKFVVSTEKQFDYWAVSPTELKCAPFTISKTGTEKITIRGREETAVRARLTLAGALSIFWGADLWLRASDGLYLRYQGTSGPGTPEVVFELAGRTD